MYISLNTNNNHLKKSNLLQGKNNNVVADFSSPAFTSKVDVLVKTAKKVNIQKLPGFSRLQGASSRVLGKLSLVLKNYSDDAVKSKPFKSALSELAKKSKMILGYCTAAITGAIVYVSSLGDEVKGRLRANIKPVSLIKDIVIRSTSKIKDMNRPDFAALQRMNGPGAFDVTQKAIDGAAKATNIDLSGSIKNLLARSFSNN